MGGGLGADSDSDFSIAGDDLASKRKTAPAKDAKPKIAKPAEYRHAINREALTDEWEDEVLAMPDNPSKLCCAFLGSRVSVSDPANGCL